MSAVATAAISAPLTVKLKGSRDLRRELQVERTASGYIYVSVWPQLKGRRYGDDHKGWFSQLACVSMLPGRDGEVQILYRTGITLFVGNVLFPLLAAEADELAAKFGFDVRKEQP